MKYLILLSLAFISSCGNEGKSSLHPIKEEHVSRYVNQKSMPEDPNLTLDKSIVNTSYPIQIALYKDGSFYYDLPNLGEGKGSWKNENGKIKLKAKRSLFDMHIDVEASDPEAQNLTIQFTDRFGPNVLSMKNVNI